MTSTPLTPALFRERFGLAAFPDGGIVVDLETGSYSRLNGTAASILSALNEATSEGAAIESLVARFGIPAARAREDLQGLARALAQDGVRIEPIDSFRYRQSDDGGYDLWHGQHLTVHVTPDLQHVTLGVPPEALPLDVYEYVSDLAPKVMFLLGSPTLHGSVWQGPEGVLGMCGKSKAGKTTTARTLARHAGRLVSEDLIVLVFHGGVPHLYTDAEAKIDQWARETAQKLKRGAPDGVDTQGLVQAATGPTVPLTSLWFLDATRRGERFHVTSLPKTAALAELLTHGFLGGAGPDSWRRFLAAGHTVISAVTAYEAALPKGLERLDVALADYARNSAS